MPQYPMPYAILPLHIMRHYQTLGVLPATLTDIVARESVIEVTRAVESFYYVDTFQWERRNKDDVKSCWRLQKSEKVTD